MGDQKLNIKELIDNLSMSATFSTVDLTTGYWQVLISESSKQKAALSFLNNQFQFKVMSFGLSNAPATISKTNDVSHSRSSNHSFFYDIIVPNNSGQ